jgi:hypothetical protein
MRNFIGIVLCIGLLCVSATVMARSVHGITIDEQLLTSYTLQQQQVLDSSNALLHAPINAEGISIVRTSTNKSYQFLAILGLFFMVGVFNIAVPSYFKNLFKVFRNPSLATRQLKEQLRQDSAASLVLDLIFCTSLGLYFYQALVHLHHQQITTRYPVVLIVIGLILMFVIVYLVRYVFLKFTGWAFNIQEITDSYTFNVFLINKILGIVLLPFTAVLAFAQGPWVSAVLILSFVLIGFLFLNRYIRSSVIFGYFLKFSRFHFFLYLCASELLPLAVLLKLVNNLLVY